MGRAAARKIPLGEQDLELLRFLAEHRFVLPDHAAALLNRSGETARARLVKLVDGGYARCEPLFRGQPPYFIRRAGLAVIGSTLPAPRPDARVYQHDIGVAWLW